MNTQGKFVWSEIKTQCVLLDFAMAVLQYRDVILIEEEDNYSLRANYLINTTIREV